MNLGQFREFTKDLPDDTILSANMGDGDAWETDGPIEKLPPVLEHPWLVVIGIASEITLEVELDMRRDAQEECRKR